MGDHRPADPNTVVSRTLTAEFSAAPFNLELSERLARSDDRVEEDDYWTLERIARANPFPRKTLQDVPPPAVLDDDELRSIVHDFGKAYRKKSTPPTDAHTSEFKALVAEPYDTERVPNRSVFPYSAIGKLLATVNGADFAGSAWVVGDRAIITAGHCVFDDSHQQWAANIAFMPQFDDRPIRGIWKASSIHTLAGWIAGGRNAVAFDLGAAVLQKPIASITCKIGWRANIAANQGLLHAVGYPSDWISASYDFDGRHMWSCNGNYVGGTTVIGMNNNMTRGSSGGPWLVQDRQGQIFACGVNSHYAEDHSNIMYSSYFGQGIVNLVRIVA